LDQTHGYILKHDKKMYVWGCNYQHCIDSSDLLKLEPGEVTSLTKLEVDEAYCREGKRYFLDKNGKVHHYVYSEEKQGWKLKVMDLGFKNSIKMLALSYNFALFLTSSGQIYSQGSNKRGELGLGFASRK
jgi:alpha-tubulin suppressor-like RCC1 family protein